MVRAAAGIAAFSALAAATPATGQPKTADRVPPGTAGAAAATKSMVTNGLRAHVGTDVAMRLVQSVDPDERLRGVERLAGIHTPEALGLLERAAAPGVPGAIDPRAPLEGIARTDPRGLLMAVRGLATWLDREPARAALASILGAPTQSFATRAAAAPSRDPTADEAKGGARILLARQEAAIALAESGNVLALDALIAIARSAGPGQGPALDALAIHPPSTALLGGVVLTTPATVALATAVGDIRSLDAIEATLSASDPTLRAAALVALGIAGDSRVIEAAKAGLHDPDTRVRLAAGDALIRLGAPDAALAVEGLVADDATALDALRLARLVQGDGVTKAAAARAAVTADADLRAAAVGALGRQASPLAIGALSALVADRTLQGDAACAMARSPSAAAMAAIEAIARTSSTRRVAARAYLVRRLVRMERSAPLDALVERLAGSSDARDRAVGVEALVAFGERPVAPSLRDADARVRRAAAMGALARWDSTSRSALLARMGVESDEVTRQVLGLGLIDGDADGAVTTAELVARAQGGGPDAPLAALALAERADEQRSADVDALLDGSDPVVRAHVARGLGASAAPDAVGRLARAYGVEGDVEVRRAAIGALSAGVHRGASAPAGREALQWAARLDPDRTVRWTALRALAGLPAARRSVACEVAWLRLVPAEGATLPKDMAGALVGSDGVALPIAFDEDGYAIVPGIAPGDARLRLAPRPPPYESPPL
jgi:HEAT repeat protein